MSNKSLQDQINELKFLLFFLFEDYIKPVASMSAVCHKFCRKFVISLTLFLKDDKIFGWSFLPPQ